MAGNGSPLDVARDVDSTMKRTSKALQAATKAALADAGKVARAELMSTATIVPGPDRRFSNWRAPALGVKARQRPGMLTVSPVGPWKVAEVGADPHPKNHPGTRRSQGRKAWTKGQDATFDRLEAKVPEQIGDAVEDAFSG